MPDDDVDDGAGGDVDDEEETCLQSVHRQAR